MSVIIVVKIVIPELNTKIRLFVAIATTGPLENFQEIEKRP
jgi:hypothetical protein